MEPINTGGPAFPTIDFSESGHPYSDRSGMTLRDYFAAAALQGQLSDPTVRPTDNKKFAENCYAWADAMLAAREAK